MNYVKSFDLLEVDVQQIPCIVGEGVPSTTTEGAVGCLYMDTLTGDIYKCIAVASGAFTWRLSCAFPYNKYSIPTVYFDGDITAMNKDNAVTLSYRYGDRSGTCTLKWQGSSSLAYPKKNYTVKFDTAFEAAEGWGAEKKYCLKADWVDFSHCRNVVSAKLWGDVVRSRATSELVTRLSALPNCGAIDGFPCFVVINGEWLGVYNFNIPKDGYMFGMGNGANEAILCAEGIGGTGEIFFSEATIGEGNVDFALEYSSDSWSKSDIQASLNRLIRAVINSNGTDIDTTIAQYLDIDSAIDYMIYSGLLNHHDGISKNYILATYDGVKWFFSAYDLDNVFGFHFPGDVVNSADISIVLRSHKLFNLLYVYKHEELKARYKELVTGALSKAAVDAKFSNYALKIPMPAYIADAELWSEVPSTSVNNIDQALSWYGERIKWCDKQTEAMEYKFGTAGLAYSGGASKGMGTCIEPNIKIAEIDGNAYTLYIGTSAFANEVVLESVVIPTGRPASPNVSAAYPDVNKQSFSGCTSLKKITFPSIVASLNQRCFENCTSLKTVTLPRVTTFVGIELFLGCTSLSKVIVPRDFLKMSADMFKNCTALKDIFYGGTMAEWETLTKDTGWNTNTGNYTVHCTDGNVDKT